MQAVRRTFLVVADDDGIVGDFLGSAEDRLTRVERKLAPLVDGQDDDEIMMIGIGPLETLFHQGHEDLLWPRIERLARSDEKFRRALKACWAFESPRFDDRRRLLEELAKPPETN